MSSKNENENIKWQKIWNITTHTRTHSPTTTKEAEEETVRRPTRLHMSTSVKKRHNDYSCLACNSQGKTWSNKVKIAAAATTTKTTTSSRSSSSRSNKNCANKSICTYMCTFAPHSIHEISLNCTIAVSLQFRHYFMI